LVFPINKDQVFSSNSALSLSETHGFNWERRNVSFTHEFRVVFFTERRVFFISDTLSTLQVVLEHLQCIVFDSGSEKFCDGDLLLANASRNVGALEREDEFVFRENSIDFTLATSFDILLQNLIHNSSADRIDYEETHVRRVVGS